MMAGRIASERRPVMIRTLLKKAGGAASVGHLYSHLVDVAGHTLRQVNQALEYLVERGEVLLLPDCQCRLVEKPDGRKRKAFRTLWRAAHQLSLRGAFSSGDLSQVSGVHRQGAVEWLQEMRKRRLIREVARFRYRLAKGAPHRDHPPLFRWARRGKARTSRDWAEEARLRPGATDEVLDEVDEVPLLKPVTVAHLLRRASVDWETAVRCAEASETQPPRPWTRMPWNKS